MPPLKNIRHENFCHEYLKDGHGDRAYVAAGFKAKQLKDKSFSASVLANHLLKNVLVINRIAELQRQMANRFVIDRGRVLQEMYRIGTSDVRKILSKQGYIAEPEQWDDDTAAAVAGVEVFEEFEGTGKDRKKIGETRKVKLWDKNSSLNMLAKHLALFADDAPKGGDTYNLTQYNITLPSKLTTEPVTNGHALGNGHAIERNGHAES